jgi:hypothetical protein
MYAKRPALLLRSAIYRDRLFNLYGLKANKLPLSVRKREKIAKGFLEPYEG